MTVNEYLIILEEELKYYPKKKRKVIINIYRDKFNTDIDLGIEEEKITASYPTPYEVAKEQYEKEGINYLDRRKRQTKSNDIFKSIITGIGLILTFSAALFLSFYIGYSIVRLIKLVTLLNGAKDIILTILFVIPFILFLVVIYLYLVDIFILIFEYLLEIFLIGFNKKLNPIEFSIVDYLEEKLKKEKLFRKTLIITCVCMIFFGLVNYFGHSYFYRSFTKATPNAYVTEYSDASTNINLKIDEAKIKVVEAPEFKITINSEFERKLNVENISDVLYISTNNLQYFDFLDFLKEPLPEVIIEIPATDCLSISLDSGNIEITGVNLSKNFAKINQGNIIVSDSSINEVELTCTKGGVSINNLICDNTLLSLVTGKTEINGITGSALKITNVSSDVQIEKANFAAFDYTSTNGDILINEANIYTSNVNLASCDADFVNITGDSFVLKSTAACNVSYSNSTITTLDSITLGGGVVCLSLDSNANIETAGTFLGKDLKGSFKIKSLGSFFELTQSKLDSIEIETNRCEATIEYIKADKFKYITNNSKSVLYFIFGKEMKIQDDKGELLLDNDSSIRDEIALYTEYYQKVEKLDISARASFRIESGYELTNIE